MSDLLAFWQPLLPSSPHLGAARVAAHWALQPVAAAAAALVPRADDDSHTAFSFDPTSRCFVSRPLDAAATTTAALSLERFSASIRVAGRERSELALGGRTLRDALGWLERELGVRGLELPTYDLPAHASAVGAPFEAPDTDALEELARWYANARTALEAQALLEPGSSPVRCWPHHFDVATLVTVVPANDAEEARTIGIGMSPGDGSYAEPYFYVTPWPYPDDRSSVAELGGGGHWHREPWFGAVLEASALVGDGEPRGQTMRIDDFLRTAIAACRGFVDRAM